MTPQTLASYDQGFYGGVVPVTVWMRSGERRVIENADDAETDGYFVWFTAPGQGRNAGTRKAVLTLRAAEMDHVEIEKSGSVTQINFNPDH